MTWIARLHFLLAPFALLYRIGVFLRNQAYEWNLFRSHALPQEVKVISIGNLSTGGTGKTPMAEYLIRHAQDLGLRTAYLSRGYGRKTKGYLRVVPGETNVWESGDEALQVATKFPGVPVAVCEDRVAGARQLISEAGIDLLILDDAFQHRRIQRDADIVIVDATRPPWQDKLLPWGRLREPMGSLGRADLVVVNKLQQRRVIPQFRHHIRRPVCFAQMKPQRLVPALPTTESLSIDQLRLRTVLAFSGLGNNEAFRTELVNLGCNVLRHFHFPDHHFYKPTHLKFLASRYRKLMKQGDIFKEQPIIITTEKDYIRLKGQDWFNLQFAQIPVYYLEVQLAIVEGEALLTDQLMPLLQTEHADLRSAAV